MAHWGLNPGSVANNENLRQVPIGPELRSRVRNRMARKYVARWEEEIHSEARVSYIDPKRRQKGCERISTQEKTKVEFN